MGKSQSRQASTEAYDVNCARFALVGQSGCGKSAFVNAVRGIDDDHELAAEVSYVETGAGPTEYIYPTNPLVSFYDLPGYGLSDYPDIPTYWNKLKLNKFDRFLIFLSGRISGLDVELLKKVKSVKKSFFLIRTKIDIDCKSEKHKCQFNEKELLNKITNYMIKQLESLRCTEENIFLISSYEKNQWDFFRLIQAIMNVLPAPEIDPSADLTEQEYLADAREYIAANGVEGINAFLEKKLAKSKEVKIRFAITGRSGAGKSAFINAIRGLKDDDYDNGAANVGVVETTTIPTEYKHPDNEMISFWDLPGIGTPNYPDLDSYCEKVGLEDYDTFLVFTASRFTNYDLQLAEKVKSIRKSFFLIRTKIDIDCKSEKEKKAFCEKTMLGEIRKKLMDNVEKLISNENYIFLISNYDPDKWDFDRLIAAISDALPVLQKEALTLSLSNVTHECLKRKTKFLRAQAVVVACLSGAAGAIPVPGLDFALDVALIKGSIAMYYKVLGLNKLSPDDLTKLECKMFSCYKKYDFKSTKSLVTSLLKFFGPLLGVEEAAKYIPILGFVIAGCVSFGLTLNYLLRCVSELEKVALAVWDNEAKRAIQDGFSETSKDN